MRGNPVRIASCAVTVVAMMTTGLLDLAPAQAAQAASDIVSVPCSVRALILAMNSIISGEELSLASNCTYLLTRSLPVVSEDLTISGHGSTLERSYAQGTPEFIILQSDAASLTVSRLSFRNGDGAITMSSGELYVTGGTFTGNNAVNGGAISESFAKGNGPVVTDAAFIDNRATGSGGAIYDFLADRNGVQATDCLFRGNEAANFGGSIDDVSEGANVVGSVFLGNTGGNGGALFLIGSVLSHDVLEGNSAIGNGGAIYSQLDLTIDSSKFSDNHAGDTGGGLYLAPAGNGEAVIDSEFTGNSATNGGAIGDLAQLEFALYHVTIFGNYASAHGGGIYNETFFAAMDTQITSNIARSGGGGIYDNDVVPENFETPTLTNSSVLYNKPDNCEPVASIPGCTD
jgi:predicted outer membrane repeat protein